MSGDYRRLATPGVRTLEPYLPGKPSSELERELGLTDVVQLASNESPLGPGPRARAAAAKCLDSLGRYPDSNGFALKAALSRRLAVPEDSLTLGNGSNDILDLVARAFVSPEHEVVVAEHAFIVFALSAWAVSARLVVTPARDRGHDLDAMQRAVTERTRLVFIANPNNPTGTWLAAEPLEAFLRAMPPHVIVVVDQAYLEYVERDDYADCITWLERFPNLIVTRTFSKAYGLAALRIGYAVSDPGIADYLNRVRQPFNVNAVALAAAEAALDDTDQVARAREVNDAGLRQLAAAFDRMGLARIPSIGNFIAVDVGRPGTEVFSELLAQGVIVRPIANYGMPDHLRISVGLAEENERCITALERVLARPA